LATFTLSAYFKAFQGEQHDEMRIDPFSSCLGNFFPWLGIVFLIFLVVPRKKLGEGFFAQGISFLILFPWYPFEYCGLKIPLQLEGL
jgi:hypothetical protein